MNWKKLVLSALSLAWSANGLAADLKIQLKSEEAALISSGPSPALRIVNTGSNNLPLESVELRYWFDCNCKDEPLTATAKWVEIDHPATLKPDEVIFKIMTTALGDQTHAVRMGFRSKAMLAPGKSATVHLRFGAVNWSKMRQSDDWSYANNTDFKDAPKVSAYVGGKAAWGQAPPVPKPRGPLQKHRSHARANDFMGINQWVDAWDDVTMLSNDTPKVASWIRWYTFMPWFTAKRGEFYYNPVTPGFDFDDWLNKWHSSGLKVSLSMMHSAEYASSWRSNGNNGTASNVYPPSGTKSGFAPEDYADFSQWVFQTVARYGSKPQSAASLRTKDKRTALGTLDAIQIGNEPDFGEWQSWKHDTCNKEHGSWCDIDGKQIAAFQKAVLAASKKADPRIRVSGPVAGGFNQTLLNNLEKQGALDGLDAIDVHTYLGGNIGDKGAGFSPEYENTLVDFCRRATEWRDSHQPSKELWLSEFGWDAHDDVERAPTFIGVTLKEQANFLVRSFVIGSAWLDKMFWFMGADSKPDMASTQFENCGIVRTYTQKNPAKDPSVIPKRAYWAMALLKKQIGSMDYMQTLVHGRQGVYAYAFKDPKSNRGVVVAWAARHNVKTDTGFKVANAKLNLPGKSTTCSGVWLVDGSYNPSRKTLALNGQSVTVNLSETPMYLELNGLGAK